MRTIKRYWFAAAITIAFVGWLGMVVSLFVGNDLPSPDEPPMVYAFGCFFCGIGMVGIGAVFIIWQTAIRNKPFR